MATLGKFKSLDKAIRDSLWHEPQRWITDDNGRVLVYEDGLELVKPMNTNRWTVSRPLGYIKVSWYTHFVINAMVHRETSRGTPF